MLNLESLTDALERRGVDRIFGLPGTQTIELFEALRTSGIRVVLATNETSAAFMANGYFRSGGRPGVVLTIGGPGFTWALPGIAEARLDSVALIHLVTAPTTAPGRAFRLQAIEQEAIAGPLLKGSCTLGPGSDVDASVEAAFDLALGGGPGPVMIQLARSGDGTGLRLAAGLDRRASGTVGVDGMDEARSRFREARRPLLLLGQGSLDASRAVGTLVERDGVPVLTTPSARGVVSEDHARCMPFDVLRGGVDDANRLLERADLVVAVGARLGHNGSAGFQLRIPEDRFVHVDRDPAVPGANYPASLEIVADAGAFLEGLVEARSGAGSPAWDAAELEEIRRSLLAPATDAPEPVVHGPDRLTPAAFFGMLRSELADDAILVTDTGLHQILARRHFRVRAPRGLVMPSDFQSMGFGLPAAIGASLADHGRPVVALMGDGGFLMSGMELVTAVREEIPLAVVVFNDGRLNQIRLDQLQRHGHESAVALGRLDLAAFADAVGVEHHRFDELGPDGLAAVLRPARPTLLEVGVGDSWAIRKSATRARVKGAARAALGERLIGWLKGRR